MAGARVTALGLSPPSFHEGDSNFATSAVVQVICIPSHAKLLSCKCTVDSCKYDDSDFAAVQGMTRLSIYTDDSKFLHEMVHR